jgi:uncharacterized protein
LFWAPVWLVSALASRLRAAGRWILPIVALGSVLTLLYADAFIYEIYGYHINGFVLNLVFTPGGIDSLGGSDGTQLMFAGRVVGFYALSAVLWIAAVWISKRAPMLRPNLRRRYLWLLFTVFAVGERMAYGFSNIYGYSPVMTSASVMPAYQPMTFKHLAKTLGVEPQRSFKYKDTDGLHLNYPRAPLQMDTQIQPRNIVWLVAESWRWDMLDAHIMPHTWEFAQQAARFTDHFSGGNGTRMGMFSLFYGLHGPYWFPMLKEHRPPVVMEQLKTKGYQWQMYTSAKFSYPEFDKTIFANVEPGRMDDNNAGPGWKDDQRHVSQMLDFIANRDVSKPFMTFMFFESPHARYYFPEENAIESGYLEDFNYATMDLARDIAKIKKRYINSCNHLDSQFGRILDYLRDNDLLKDTIVIITGDHGEEFMENGRWGHNSMFHDQQIRTPFIVWVPGMTPAVYSHQTSHIDWIPTLMPLLGVVNPVSDYAQGKNLFDGSERPYRISSDWSSLAVIDDDFKIRLPLSSSGIMRNEVTTSDDQPIADDGAVIAQRQKVLVAVLKSLAEFGQK